MLIGPRIYILKYLSEIINTNTKIERLSMELVGQVRGEKRGDIVVLKMDNPPVNAISSGVRVGLYDGIKAAQQDPSIKAVVIAGGPKAFAAGADIREFGGDPTKPLGMMDVRKLIQAGELPVVAAINGVALGGGLELAMYCDFRVAESSAKVGLPELKLGIIPGAGGTQHLPRLIGAERALDLILGSKPLAAMKACEQGIIDEVCEGDLLDAACAVAQDAIDGRRARVDIRERNDKISLDQNNTEVFDNARKFANKKLANQFAPLKAIEAVKAAISGDYEAGLAVERACLEACLAHPQRAAMIHLFFAERQANKIPGLPKGTAVADIKTIAVVGLGMMGSGIAVSCLASGYSIIAMGHDDPSGEKAVGRIRGMLERDVKSGRLSEQGLEQRLVRLTGASSLAELSEADLVIEAVYETMAPKLEVFTALGRVMKPGAILATNTSGLDIDQMAEASGRPDKVLGLHFFNPANVMRLLEVVRGAKTSHTTLATGMAVAKGLGKTPVVAGNADGFIGNRMVQSYNNQSRELLLSGAYPHQVDKLATGFGLAMGPFQLQDLVGLSLLVRMHEGVEDIPDRVKPHFAVQATGRQGRSNGKGFYRYEEDKKGPQYDPEVDGIIDQVREELGYETRAISDEEVHQRLFYALINAGAHLLGEGIALRASDIDVVYHFGYAFPIYRGGPMFYADQVGVTNVYEAVVSFHEKYGDLWKPAPLLKELAESGKTFAEWQQEQEG
jgi:3-hydroxyacyl-CoA dehydrogenase